MKEKIIGLYQLITGIFGVILLVFNIQNVLSSFSLIFLMVIGLLLFAATAYAGYALINNLKNGVKYSIILQAIQSVGFIFGGLQYKFTCSAFLALAFGSGKIFQFQISPLAFSISYAPETSANLIIYLIPLLFILLLAIKNN